MKRYLIISAIILSAAATAGAQNLNPTVEVTNQFEGKVMEVAKPVVDMAVPDSLLRFDLNFDYSVFDTPYKGTYEFSPYLLEMQPQPDAYRGRSFYLRLGAGYALHPTADLVFSPEWTGPFQLNVYGMHRSYFGPYRMRLGDFEWDGKGHDMLTKAGANGRYDYGKGAFTFDAGYYGIHTKNESYIGTNGFNAFDLKARVQSLGAASFLYDAALSFRAASEASSFWTENLGVKDFGFDAVLGPELSETARLVADVHFGINAYDGLFPVRTGAFSVAPKYVWNADRWRIAAGVRLSTTFRSGDEEKEGWTLHTYGTRKGQVLYPDVHIGYEAVTDRLNLYASLTGGEHIWSYSELKERNPFTDLMFAMTGAPLFDNSVERVRAAAGLQGNIASKFRYDVSVGWHLTAGGLLDAVYEEPRYGSDDADDPSDGIITKAASADVFLMPGHTYADYAAGFIKADLAYDARPVSFAGGVDLHIMNSRSLSAGFVPASVAWGEVAWHWMDRVRAGVRADGAFRRPGAPAYDAFASDGVLAIPGYLNLGLFGEYAVTRTLSLWVRGDNLLNANIQRHPLCPSGGISVTGGIILNL